MGVIDELRINLTANTADFDRKMKKAGATTETFTSKAVKAGAAAAAAFAAIGAAAGYAVKEYAAAEAAQSRLAATFKSLGANVEQQTARFTKLAAAVQVASTESDEGFNDAVSKMAGITKRTGDELQDLSLAALGLSRAMGVNLDTAVALVGRTAAGANVPLARYGVIVKDDATQQEKLNALLEKGRRGMVLVDAETKTTAGSWKIFKNQVSDAAEKVGEFLVKNTKLVEILRESGRFVAKIPLQIAGAWNVAREAFERAGASIGTAIAKLEQSLTGIIAKLETTLAIARQISPESHVQQGASFFLDPMAYLGENLGLNALWKSLGLANKTMKQRNTFGLTTDQLSYAQGLARSDIDTSLGPAASAGATGIQNEQAVQRTSAETLRRQLGGIALMVGNRLASIFTDRGNIRKQMDEIDRLFNSLLPGIGNPKADDQPPDMPSPIGRGANTDSSVFSSSRGFGRLALSPDVVYRAQAEQTKYLKEIAKNTRDDEGLIVGP